MLSNIPPKYVAMIVPRLPPAIDGVGDYALSIAGRLRLDFNIHTHFIVCDPSWSGGTSIDGFSITKVMRQNKQILLDILDREPHDSSIVLQYVLHGYAKKGCPFWLIEALEEWKKKKRSNRLVSMFHEIYSMGPGVVPWNTDFWLLPWQKQLAKRLFEISDQALTSSQRYAERLYRQSARADLEVITVPVPSNIGEPNDCVPLTQRKKRLVIFGQGGNKARVYAESDQVLQVCQYIGAEEIIDIGPSSVNLSERIVDIPILKAGVLEPQAISEILVDSLAGLLSYDPERLAKSGIFAAYSSHGVLPINLQLSSNVPDGLDGLTAEHHYLTPMTWRKNAASSCDVCWQKVASSAKVWYGQHSKAASAQVFAKAIGVLEPSSTSFSLPKNR
jgi:GNAT superfamily N-acetyltransferase